MAEDISGSSRNSRGLVNPKIPKNVKTYGISTWKSTLARPVKDTASELFDKFCGSQVAQHLTPKDSYQRPRDELSNGLSSSYASESASSNNDSNGGVLEMFRGPTNRDTPKLYEKEASASQHGLSPSQLSDESSNCSLPPKVTQELASPQIPLLKICSPSPGKSEAISQQLFFLQSRGNQEGKTLVKSPILFSPLILSSPESAVSEHSSPSCHVSEETSPSVSPLLLSGINRKDSEIPVYSLSPKSSPLTCPFLQQKSLTPLTQQSKSSPLFIPYKNCQEQEENVNSQESVLLFSRNARLSESCTDFGGFTSCTVPDKKDQIIAFLKQLDMSSDASGTDFAVLENTSEEKKDFEVSGYSPIAPAVLSSQTSLISTPDTVFSSTPIANVIPGKRWRRSLASTAYSTNMKMKPWRNRLINLSQEIAEESPLKKYELSPEEAFLDVCGQKEPLYMFRHFNSKRLHDALKIGEGVYGEVFLLKATDTEQSDIVVKLVPVEGELEVNGESQKSLQEMLVELKICKALSDLKEAKNGFSSVSFVHLQSCRLLKGRYPKSMLQLWDDFHSQKGSENDRPDQLPSQQLFVCLEFDPAGKDLEKYAFRGAAQVLSVFWQVAFALAVAEEVLSFEHRDLHWGNVLVAPTKEAVLEVQLKNSLWCVPTKGTRATVIDFTLSRATMDGEVAFCNLAADPTLFEAYGDPQFQVYRDMKQHNGNDWSTFQPFTNILWLHYLLDKLSLHVRFQRGRRPSEDDRYLITLRNLYEKVLSFSGAAEFVKKEASLSMVPLWD